VLEAWCLARRSPFGEASEADGVRSRSRKQKCAARGNPDYDGAGERVEEEVVAGRDDDEEHEGRVEQADEANGASATVPKQARGHDECVADVHARDCGVGVIERADEARVEVDWPPETVSVIPIPLSRGGAVG
jgi:hypothetical protein